MEIVEFLRERLSKDVSRIILGAAVVIMVIVTTLITPPLLKWMLAEPKAAPSPDAGA
jgi:hypothetical protein